MSRHEGLLPPPHSVWPKAEVPPELRPDPLEGAGVYRVLGDSYSYVGHVHRRGETFLAVHADVLEAVKNGSVIRNSRRAAAAV